MKKQRNIFMVFGFVSLVLICTLYYIDYKFYKGMLSSFPMMILIYMFINSLVSFFFNKNMNMKIYIISNIVVMLFSITIFYINRPNLTYKEAELIVIENGLEELKDEEIYLMMPTKLDLNNKYPRAYMFKGTYEENEVYMLISPIDGSIQIEEIGKSYIDEALILIKEK